MWQKSVKNKAKDSAAFISQDSFPCFTQNASPIPERAPRNDRRRWRIKSSALVGATVLHTAFEKNFQFPYMAFLSSSVIAPFPPRQMQTNRELLLESGFRTLSCSQDDANLLLRTLRTHCANFPQGVWASCGPSWAVQRRRLHVIAVEPPRGCSLPTMPTEEPSSLSLTSNISTRAKWRRRRPRDNLARTTSTVRRWHDSPGTRRNG